MHNAFPREFLKVRFILSKVLHRRVCRADDFTKKAQDAPPLAVGRNGRSWVGLAVEFVLEVQVFKAPLLAAG